MKFDVALLAGSKDGEQSLVAEVLGRIPRKGIHHDAGHRVFDIEGAIFGLSSELLGIELSGRHDVSEAAPRPSVVRGDVGWKLDELGVARRVDRYLLPRLVVDDRNDLRLNPNSVRVVRVPILFGTIAR